MENREKSILKGIYLLTIMMFLLLMISMNKLDFGPIILGVSSCVLIGYGYFIIKKFFPNGDKYLLIIVAFISQFGLVMLYRLSSVNAIKQLSWFTIGMGEFIFLVVFLPHIRKFGKLKYTYAIIAIILLALPLFLGSEIKGSKNWIRFGSFGIQPSEIAKLFIIFYLASALQNTKNFLDVIKTAIPVFIGIAFLVIEKDLGASLIFFGIFITMLYISTSNLKYILSGIGAFLGGGVLSYLMFSHIRIRFKIWIDPWKYINGSGYQICQSLIAIATGGLFGTGIGLGHPYLIPEAHNDFIFAAICEELGLLGGIALILLYLMLIYRGLRTALHARDGYSMLVAVGISSMIAFQVFVIIGGVIKLIPLTGITLPFVSYGGSSMILNFASLGVLQKISESGRKSI
jgi:cell division protein FtsW (lipid II flippase)